MMSRAGREAGREFKQYSCPDNVGSIRNTRVSFM